LDKARAERPKQPQASIRGTAIGAAIGGLESREHPNPEQGRAGGPPSGEVRPWSVDNAPAATKGSRPSVPDRTACVFDET
jgi:hypothetical protein